MKINPLKEKIRQGQVVCGVWCGIPSPALIELISAAGVDFVVLDGEHAPFDIANLENCIRAAEVGGAAALVRSPGHAQGFVQKALDMGAHGVLVPQVATVAQAQEIARWFRFAPEGTRGLNPFVRVGGYGNLSQSRLSSDWALSCVLVESPEGFAALDEIAATSGIDMVFLGAYDYSATIGKAGQMDDPQVRAFVEQGIARIRAAGKIPFVLQRVPERIEAALQQGAQVVAIDLDTAAIQQLFAARVDMFRSLTTAPITAPIPGGSSH